MIAQALDDARAALESLPALSREELRHGLTWYWDAHEFCSQFAPITVSAGVLAVLSPQMPWLRNKELTRDTFNGRPPRIPNGIKADAIANYGACPYEVVSGPKVRAFWFAILEPEAMDAVPVIDTHMLQLIKWPRNYFPRPSQYAKLAEVFSEFARTRYPEHPIHAIQSALWARQRGSTE